MLFFTYYLIYVIMLITFFTPWMTFYEHSDNAFIIELKKITSNSNNRKLVARNLFSNLTAGHCNKSQRFRTATQFIL